jgi:hypothetical protein
MHRGAVRGDARRARHVVPIAHSRHTANLVPRATLRTYPQHGHLSILSELPAVAANLAATAD